MSWGWGLRQDYAFVHFATREAAQRALDAALSEDLYMDGALIHVAWSKPVDKQMYQTRKHLTKFLANGGVVGLGPHENNAGGSGRGMGFNNGGYASGANAVMPM